MPSTAGDGRLTANPFGTLNTSGESEPELSITTCPCELIIPPSRLPVTLPSTLPTRLPKTSPTTPPCMFAVSYTHLTLPTKA